jgi:hypothetical protein
MRGISGGAGQEGWNLGRGVESCGGYRQRVALFIACFCLASSGAGLAVAAEPLEKLVFDPVLSLTGGCAMSESDPVPDPGCPGGSHPPAGAFNLPRSIVTDRYGDIYVASYGNEAASGTQGRIDVFDPRGNFLTEIPDPSGPKTLAVDSKGNLYAFQYRPGVARQVERYEPSKYDPAAGDIEYANPPELVIDVVSSSCGLAVDRTSDHLFVHLGIKIEEFTSAEDANEPLGFIGEDAFNGTEGPAGIGLAVDSGRKRIYASDRRAAAPHDFLIDVFDLEAPHDLIRRIDGSTSQLGKFSSEPSIAVDESDGNIFAYPAGKVVYELTDQGALVDEIDHAIQAVFESEIGVDNGTSSPNAGYLFVPSNPTGTGHSFAFGPLDVHPPEISSVSVAGVTEEEAEFEGAINPGGLETSYIFEITTQTSFGAKGFEEAQVAKKGQLPAVDSPIKVSAALSGLSPETSYRFRLTATNALHNAEAEGQFTTYPSIAPREPCRSDALRTGLSAMLPDCRAYELVTPAETNARAPRGVGVLGPYFFTREASPAGDRLSFIVEGGILPGGEGTGSLGGDSYLSKREVTGWTTSPAGPSGSEAVSPLPGGVSPDQGYSFWSTGSEGSASVGGKDTAYVRYPDGHSELIGRGSLRDDPRAEGKLVTENGEHIIFLSPNFSEIGGSHKAVQLEADAPPEGTVAVYDRTRDEVTHVISLLPEDKTPKAGEDALYVGSSLDGRGIAFSIGSALFLRFNNEATFKIGNDVTFAGIAEGGNFIFYIEGGKLLRFDAVSEEIIEFNATGTAIPVNVSADGSTAYLVSTAVLTSEPNPNDAEAKAGQQNLYRSQEGTISFVGTVTEEDVTGGKTGIGLGLWAPHVVSYGEAAEDPSRSTHGGEILLFESRANLTSYDSQGNTEVYRFDSGANELTCLSCNPTGLPGPGGATLQSRAVELGDPRPLGPFASVTNLSTSGDRAFFQSTEPLVATDTDGLQDVYEWEAQGAGSCTRAGDCIYLISSGQSSRINYLYAVSDSGDDVFFRSSDLLVPADLEETASIYDARVDGGFPEEIVSDCEGEGCRPSLLAPPLIVAPESGVHTVEGKRKRCPKGKRTVRRRGKNVCVKKHHKRHHRRAGKSRGADK